MTDRIGLLGTGLLHDAIADALGDALSDSPSDRKATVLVAVTDAWDTSRHGSIRASAQESGTPWLPVWTELGHAVVGPLEVPGEAGCVECAARRRRYIRADRTGYEAVRRRHGELLAQRPSSWLTGLAGRLVAAIVAEEASRVIDGDHPRTRRALHRIALDELTVSRHPCLPDPACPVCGDLPDDSAELAELRPQPSPAHQPGSYRTRELSSMLPQILDTYVDDQCGIVHSLSGTSTGPLVFTSAPIAWHDTGEVIAGHGAASTFQASRLTAVLEALERYGSSPRGRRLAVTAPYDEVRHHALDPRTLGLHTPEQYAQPDFPYRPFSPDQPYGWVWGWSFTRNEPILVPAYYVYYGAPPHPALGERFVYEISNGCALGSTLEEAALYGLLEVAERDAFLLTWYATLPAPGIDLTTVTRDEVRLLVASIRAHTGYRVLAFDISTEQGIPCVWTMAVSPDGTGPALACAAAAHPDPGLALQRALGELGPGIIGFIHSYQDPAYAERARALAADSDLVREMADHSVAYTDPGAARRLDFLTRGEPVRAVAEIGGSEPGGFESDDVRDNLLEAVRRYTDEGMDVIVVDQTAPEHRASGFHCVKVVVPGTLPMTFGHRLRRVHDLPRLYRLPQRLGYRERPLRPEDVNPYPHPFP